MREKSSGWQGRRLRIDLTKGIIEEENLSSSYLRDWLGGRGFNIEVISREAPEGLDPFDPEAPLCFAIGPLAGTLAPCSSWTSLAARSPLTYPCTYAYEDMGGHWGAELKFAGYDQIVIKGRAEKPVFIVIEDQRVEIKEANDLWGMDTRRCTLAIQEKLKEREAKVLCIGPAGERRVRFATVVNCFSWKGGRLGLGAVMGSKNLKAIVVRGRGSVTIDDPKGFFSLCHTLYEKISHDPYAQILGKDGTLFPLKFIELGFFGNQNVRLEEDGLKSEDYRNQHFQSRDACFSCPIHCGRYSSVKSDDAHFGGFGLEDLLNLGPRIGLYQWETILRIVRFCLLMGLDTVSMGGMISWFMESGDILYNNEMVPKRGDAETVFQFMEGIVSREGDIGKMLGEGILRVAQNLGKGENGSLPVVKGVEEASFDPRVRPGTALSFSLSPRGGYLGLLGCWEIPEMAEYYRPRLEESIGKTISFPLTRNEEIKLIANMETREVAASLVGVCPLIVSRLYTYSLPDLSSVLQKLTGMDIAEQDLTARIEKVIDLERLYRGADGMTRDMDTYPQKYFHQEVPSGKWRGRKLEKEEWNESLSLYYRIRRWNGETGLPQADLLSKWGLKEKRGKYSASP